MYDKYQLIPHFKKSCNRFMFKNAQTLNYKRRNIMNKKILTIFALLIVITSISAVSAFDLGDLFGSGENQTTTIDGIDFNIPAGYENHTDEIKDNVSEMFKDEIYNVTGEGYAKGSTGVMIAVLNYADIGISDEDIAAQFLSDTPTTINGVNGSSLTDETGAYIFNYQKDGKLVVISSDSEKTVSEFVIA